MRTAQQIVRSYKQIAGDYAYVPTPFTEDDARTRRAKWVVQNRLSPSDRTIIILYAELGSYRKLGARLGMSHTTVRKEVHRIREIIKANL